MKTRLPRSSFHHAVVTCFGSRRSISRANASAQRRTTGNSHFGSIRQATWMPRLPEVFGQPVQPISASVSRTTTATCFASPKSVPGCGSMSIRSSSGRSTSARRDGHGMEVDDREVRRPGDLRDLGDAELVGVPAGREGDARRLDPLGPLLGHALLVDHLALDAVRKPAQLRRPLVERAHDSLADREVVLDEVELRLLPRRKEHLLRVRHLDDPLAHLELDERRRHLPGRVPRATFDSSLHTGKPEEMGMRKVLISVVVIALAIAAAALGGRGEAAAAADAVSCAKADLESRQGRAALDRHRQPGLPAVVRGRRDEGPAVEDQRPGDRARASSRRSRTRSRSGSASPGRRSCGSTRLSRRRSRRVRSRSTSTINQISYTPARAKALAFSASYYNVNQSIVGLKGKPIASVRSIAGLRKYKLGAQLGTTSYQYIVNNIKPSRSPAVYDTNDAAVAALKNGQIDGLVVDLPTAFYVTAVQVPNGKIIGQFAAKGNQERFGMVFQKGNPLVTCVNNALANMKRTGVLQRIQQIWLAKVTGAPVLK